MSSLDFWPTDRQELLLSAALADSEVAIPAWREWRSKETIETTDRGSWRLLPLVYFNLARSKLDDPAIESLKETYSRTRLANRIKLTHLTQLLKFFDEEEIPTLLLKGAALALQIYRDPGLRPMADLDLAVPHHCAGRAMEALKRNGWRSEPCQAGGKITPDYFAAVQFQDKHGLELDLHFSPFHDYAPFFRDRLAWANVAPLWAAAVPLCVGKNKTLTLAPTDHLLHTLDHGAVAHEMPPIRWVADAIWLLRGQSPIAWDRFTAQADALHLSLVAAKALAYLRDRHGADVPSAVIRTLGRHRSALEKLEYSSRQDRLPRWIAARKCWAVYAREYPDRGFAALVIGFVEFLKLRWSARNAIDLVWRALKHLLFPPR